MAVTSSSTLMRVACGRSYEPTIVVSAFGLLEIGAEDMILASANGALWKETGDQRIKVRVDRQELLKRIEAFEHPKPAKSKQKPGAELLGD